MGVAAPHLVGLGGGFLALYYDDERDHVEALNALGISPANVANVDEKAAKRGAKASIVPGALRGYQELHKRLNGTMKWEDLFAPAIKLAKEGFPIKKHFADVLAKHQNEISATDIKSIFNSVHKADDKLVQLEMAQLLEELSKKGADFFYTEVAKNIIRGLGPEALLTMDDFKNYTPVWYPPVTKKLGSATLYAPPFPSSGVLLLEAIPMRVLERSQDIKPIMDMTSEDEELIKRAQDELSSVLAKLPALGGEAAKKGFPEVVEEIRSSINAGKNATQSSHAIVEDYGGVHLSITKDFKAVAIISGINEPFGSKKASVPGLIMNNYMSAFAAEADAPNRLRGGQQPRTSMVPVFLKDDQQRLLLLQAGSGGGIPGMWALIQVLGCISERNASFCVRSERRIRPALPSSQDKGPDIQPTASGIFTKGPLASWLAPSDDVHCDGASDGERATLIKKWEALDTKDYCKRTRVCNRQQDLFLKETNELIHS
ncbi:scoloptoxin SSD14-like isoform X2 [Dermacentor andersoni]|nr:scoloptoxin SSD14-like isoform X2 [Dermacentor andersoni]